MTAENPAWPPSAQALAAAFDSTEPYAAGIEDEVMLLSPDTLELVHRAPEVIELVGEDRRFKLELPASQIEIVIPNASHVGAIATALFQARRDLAERTAGLVRLAAAGSHPFSPVAGELNQTPRYEHSIREYGPVARRQLVCALQVHVSVGSATRALAVYNAARSYLPLLAALAANAPFCEGHDTGLASVRPKLAELLPRQGVPPPIDSWEAYAEVFGWGARTGTFPNAQTWWWELRLHPGFGTVEFRVPDGQSSVADAAAIAAVAQALVAWLGAQHDAGERLPVFPSWQIAENRWSACRGGVEGRMVELRTGRTRNTRTLLEELLGTLEPVAAGLQAGAAIGHARGMTEVNGAMAQRRAAVDGDARAAARWLTERFLASSAG